MKAQKQLKLRENQQKVREKCPRQFFKVKVRVLLRDWLICETTRTALEYKKDTKGGKEEKNCNLKFEIWKRKRFTRYFLIFLKEYESSESRIPALRVEFDKERSAMESHITTLRRQVCFLVTFQ